jgi:hypothetical protein
MKINRLLFLAFSSTSILCLGVREPFFRKHTKKPVKEPSAYEHCAQKQGEKLVKLGHAVTTAVERYADPRKKLTNFYGMRSPSSSKVKKTIENLQKGLSDHDNALKSCRALS